MAYIKSAIYGDENGGRDVKSSLEGKVSGGKIDVVADSSLIPMFEVSREVKLTEDEKKGIEAEAIKTCGGAGNTACVKGEVARVSQQRVQDKTNQQHTTVKGRRLTVTIVDANGKERQVIVPDGQTFTMEGMKGTIAPNGEKKEAGWSLPSLPSLAWSGFTTGATYGTIAAIVILWTFSLIITIATFHSLGWISLLPIGVAAVIPGAGIPLVFFAELIKQYLRNKGIIQ